MTGSAAPLRKRNDHNPNWKDNDPGNPPTETIGNPSGPVVKAAQDIKNDVQKYRVSLLSDPHQPGVPVGQQWLDQNGNVQIFDQRIRIMPETPGQNGHANPSPGYKAISDYSKKNLAQCKNNMNSHLESVKRLLKAYAYQRIDEAVQAGALQGKWRAVIRVVPLDSTNKQDPTGCGCGCS
jgi:hypothetical protein